MTPAAADRLRIYAAAFLRSLAIGMAGVLLALHLHAAGWNIERTGLLIGAGLAGLAVATLLSSVFVGRLGRRRTLRLLAGLSVGGAVALATLEQASLLFVAAFVGLINGLGRDRGPAYALEQALLPETTPPERRTFALAWYNLVLDAGLALGSLAAVLPAVLRRHAHWEPAASYQAAWLLQALLLLASLVFYLGLSPVVEGAGNAAAGALWPRVSPESRGRIARLAALTGMDSLGGGFLTGALISYWFFRRFGLGEEWLGMMFAAARVLNALSHLLAAWLARRFGLLNTMVFTHIPSSLFLIAVPFAPTAGWAVALFLAREGLVEMDVPTRQSYILAVVQPDERPIASGLTTLTRNVAYAVAPALAGLAMRSLSASSPLYIGGGIKILYDLLLYRAFRRVKPPEEAGG